MEPPFILLNRLIKFGVSFQQMRDVHSGLSKPEIKKICSDIAKPLQTPRFIQAKDLHTTYFENILFSADVNVLFNLYRSLRHDKKSNHVLLNNMKSLVESAIKNKAELFLLRGTPSIDTHKQHLLDLSRLYWLLGHYEDVSLEMRKPLKTFETLDFFQLVWPYAKAYELFEQAVNLNTRTDEQYTNVIRVKRFALKKNLYFKAFEYSQIHSYNDNNHEQVMNKRAELINEVMTLQNPLVHQLFSGEGIPNTGGAYKVHLGDIEFNHKKEILLYLDKEPYNFHVAREGVQLYSMLHDWDMAKEIYIRLLSIDRRFRHLDEFRPTEWRILEEGNKLRGYTVSEWIGAEWFFNKYRALSAAQKTEILDSAALNCLAGAGC